MTFSYNKGKHQVTREMVHDFNHELFTDTVNPDSSSYDADMCDFGTLGRHLFTPNQTWLNRDLVTSVANIMAKYYGWDAAQNQKYIICNQSGEERVQSLDGIARNTQAGPLKSNVDGILHSHFMSGNCTFQKDHKRAN